MARRVAGSSQLRGRCTTRASVRVKSTSRESVGASKHVTVGGEKDGQKWGESREHVFKDRYEAVDNMYRARFGDLHLLVGGGDGSGRFGLHVESDQMATIGGELGTKVKKKRSCFVEGDDYLIVNGGIAMKAGKAILVHSDSRIDVNAEGEVVVGSVAREVCIKGPGGFVKIDASGVTIVGTIVRINSGGTGTEGHVFEPVAVFEDQPKADPTLPDPADTAKTGQKSS